MMSKNRQPYSHLCEILSEREGQILDFHTNIFGHIQFTLAGQVVYERTPEDFMTELADVLSINVLPYEPPRSCGNDS